MIVKILDQLVRCPTPACLLKFHDWLVPRGMRMRKAAVSVHGLVTAAITESRFAISNVTNSQLTTVMLGDVG